ncbi:MAG: tRNA (N6-isopentenyl adenosine(37)-C2)-methylthiotransferase MiaB [Acutalibacteraceae bacterium]
MQTEQTSIMEQKEYISMLSDLLPLRSMGKVPKAHVRTYGCQQNVADSERIKGLLAEMGCEFTEDDSEADIVIFNTCAVREHAEDRVFGNVGALKAYKRQHPSMLIALCGCMMEQQHIAEKIYKSFPFVGLVFGTHALHKLPQMMYEALTTGKRVIERGNDDGEIHEGIPLRRDGTFKGWLPIMYGCDNFCTYCIVPHVRGRERSRTPDIILSEAHEMVNAGFKEITLLGQNVNSYGKGLDIQTDFPSLLRSVGAIDGDFWVRFMTSHPKDASKEMIDVMAENEKLCRHLHLPFQSGSDRILKRMNRHYDRKKYMEIVEYARKKIPDLALTSDIIVGFPGETYEDFKETLSLIQEVEFASLFTFIYSPRVGTPAAKMEDPISHEEKTEWFAELLAVQEKISNKRCASMVGRTYRVLVDSEEKSGLLHGTISDKTIVEFEGTNDMIGTFRNVEITESYNWILKGKLV